MEHLETKRYYEFPLIYDKKKTNFKKIKKLKNTINHNVGSKVIVNKEFVGGSLASHHSPLL